jgi:putative FmdB family regulatory protein
MPIYEYRCEACGHQEEFLQRLSEPPLTVCPVCHKPAFQKMLSAAGFQLKGSGWYATDFKTKSTRPADKKADGKSDAGKSDAGKSDAGKSDGKSADTKTDAKPEKKSEPKSEAPA